jgi:hypothetical protein
MGNEITVLVTSDFNTLEKNLVKHKFKVTDQFELNDVYMIDKSINLDKLSNLEILSKCILVRDIPGVKKSLLYKKKEYAPNGDIIKQSKTECNIDDINKAVSFMEAINYKVLFKTHAKCIAYCNNKSELLVQLVNDEYILIEHEDKPDYVDRTYSSIEEVKEDLLQYDLPIDKSNFFVKKAEIELNKVLER